MSYIVKELREEQLMAFLIAGLSLQECAEQLKVTPWTVNKYVHDEEFLSRLKDRSVDAYDRIIEASVDIKTDVAKRAAEGAAIALEEMISLAQAGKTENTRFRASQDLMDRDSRLTRTKRVEGEGLVGPKFFNSVFLQQVANVMTEEAKVVQAVQVENPS